MKQLLTILVVCLCALSVQAEDVVPSKFTIGWFWTNVSTNIPNDIGSRYLFIRDDITGKFTITKWFEGYAAPTDAQIRTQWAAMLVVCNNWEENREVDPKNWTGTQKKTYKALFVIVNELRVLKGQAPLNDAQYRTWLKGL